MKTKQPTIEEFNEIQRALTNAVDIAAALHRQRDQLLSALGDIANADYGTDTPKLRERAKLAITELQRP